MITVPIHILLAACSGLLVRSQAGLVPSSPNGDERNFYDVWGTMLW